MFKIEDNSMEIKMEQRTITISARALCSLHSMYEESLGVPIGLAYKEGYALRQYSMVFMALYRLFSHPTDQYRKTGCTYQVFADLVLYFRSQVVSTPRDYTRWYDEQELSVIDPIVRVATTASADDLGAALLGDSCGVGLSASYEIFPREDQELMKKISDKECFLIARWRLENNLF